MRHSLVSVVLCLLLAAELTIASKPHGGYGGDHDGFTPSPVTFGSNGFANWAAGTWPPANFGSILVPQSTDRKTASFIQQFEPDRLRSYVETLVSFYTRHTCSQTNSTTVGIGAARRWLFQEMTELAKPSRGKMKITMPCYFQPAQPASGMPIGADVCNVQVTIQGAVDPNRTYVYTGHYDSRRLNNSDYTGYAPGADDNASAVSIALEMVRILAPIVAKSPPAATIIIAAVAGEEQGLYGSAFLANTLANASVDVQANFNNDIVGTGSNPPYDPVNPHTIRLFTGGTSYLPTLPANLLAEFEAEGYQDDTPSRHLARFIQEVDAGAAHATDMQVAISYKPDRYGRGGDHMSFLRAGFPAVRFTEPNEDFHHQHQDPRRRGGVVYGDEAAFVDFGFAARVGRVNLLAVWSAANAPGTPRNFAYGAVVGARAANRSTPASWGENTVTLYWDDAVKVEDPLRDHFEVVWRAMASQQWTHVLKVGDEGTVRLPISKDNAVFGLRAVGRDGKKSPAMYPVAVSRGGVV